MTDPTQRRVDKALDDSMDLFQRADVGAEMAVSPKTPGSILVATDGSTQDQALILLAGQLQSRLQCRLGYCLVTEDASANEKQLADLGAQRVECDPACEHDYDRILAAVKSFGAELLMIPCPFRRDFESIGEDSAGTTMEVVASRCEIPAIYMRRPDAIGRDPTDHVRLILTRENAAAGDAAKWAAGMVQPEGRLELLLMVEESTFKNFREMMHSIQPDVEFDYEDLEGALAKMYASLHAGLQKESLERGFGYELIVRYEADPQPITPEDPRTHPALMALGLVRESHDSRNEIFDFVRRSPHPVLVVPKSQPQAE